MYLVDTNVISAGAPSNAVREAGSLKWMDEHSTELYLSAVTVAEIEDGIAKARREKAKRKAADLTAWLETLLHLYSDRVLLSMLRPLALPEGCPISPRRGLGPGICRYRDRSDGPCPWADNTDAEYSAFEPLGSNHRPVPGAALR